MLPFKKKEVLHRASLFMGPKLVLCHAYANLSLHQAEPTLCLLRGQILLVPLSRIAKRSISKIFYIISLSSL